LLKKNYEDARRRPVLWFDGVDFDLDRRIRA